MARRSTLAGLLAVTIAVATSHVLPMTGGSPDIASAAAIAVGWTGLLALLPWRLFHGLERDREAIVRMTALLRRSMHGRRDEPLCEIRLDRDDEIGSLSQAIYDCLAIAIAHRMKAGLLHRTMDHTIRRETARATADLQRQAVSDPLTGLGNRRLLDQWFEELLTSGPPPTAIITAMVIDLDRFKAINDTLGHAAGDACLRFVGELLRANLRPDDVAMRIGGDEFVVLMPGQEHHAAQVAAERISHLFGQMPWPHHALPKPSLSVGVVSARLSELEGPDDLLTQADHLMYEAKRRRSVADRELDRADFARRGAA
jgi:diguanylate cyclase (GGDEF)-like protein